ncbi:MAG: hypothetical protein EXR98_02195 [Gemmataceae bacterium]|nr:hypothetical protein [Gemmataceae bacterium]
MNTKWLVGVVVLVASASMAAAQVPPYDFKYYPLKVGNRWTYLATDLKAPDAKAAPTRRVVVEVEREEIYVDKKLNKDGKEVVTKYTGFLVKSTSGGKTTRDHVLVLADGVYRIHAAGTPISPPLPFFKTAGKWNADSVSGNTTINGTFTGALNRVNVGKTTYDAFLVSFRDTKTGDDRVEIDYWFVESIGMVKQRVRAKSHEIVLELEKFDKAK